MGIPTTYRARLQLCRPPTCQQQGAQSRGAAGQVWQQRQWVRRRPVAAPARRVLGTRRRRGAPPAEGLCHAGARRRGEGRRRLLDEAREPSAERHEEEAAPELGLVSGPALGRGPWPCVSHALPMGMGSALSGTSFESAWVCHTSAIPHLPWACARSLLELPWDCHGIDLEWLWHCLAMRWPFQGNPMVIPWQLQRRLSACMPVDGRSSPVRRPS